MHPRTPNVALPVVVWLTRQSGSARRDVFASGSVSGMCRRRACGSACSLLCNDGFGTSAIVGAFRAPDMIVAGMMCGTRSRLKMLNTTRPAPV